MTTTTGERRIPGSNARRRYSLLGVLCFAPAAGLVTGLAGSLMALANGAPDDIGPPMAVMFSSVAAGFVVTVGCVAHILLRQGEPAGERALWLVGLLLLCPLMTPFYWYRHR